MKTGEDEKRAAEEKVEEKAEAELNESVGERIAALDTAFEEVGFFTRLKRMLTGLRKPRSSAEYKLARTEVQRLAAPVAAIVCPIVFVIVLCVMTEITGEAKRTIQIDVARTQDTEDVLEEEGEQTEIEPPDDNMEVEIEIETASDLPTQVTDVVAPSTTTTATPEQTLRQPDPTSVALVKSPVAMKSVFGETRSAASRVEAMRRYGGDARTEEAVVNALRWLKTKQNKDGSWSGDTGADHQGVTGLALLTFLAHGEKSGGGEFGVCVSKGLEWLMARTEKLDPVGTHALAEAYGFLKNPNLKESATRAVQTLADELCATKWGPDDEKGLNTRPQLLRMAFQSMALKSAEMSGIAPPNLQAALDKLKEGFLIQGNQKEGGFSSDYYGPPRANYRRTGIWHFMVGVVGLQYLGFGDLSIVEKTMKILDDDWELPTLGSIDSSCCPVRGNYWATMVFFNGGGKRWARWNRSMIDVYFKGQTVQKGAYVDSHGVKRDIGYWTCEDMHVGTQPIAPTCWVSLQLMVYYRYLPTSSKKARGSRDSRPVDSERKSSAATIDVEVDI